MLLVILSILLTIVFVLSDYGSYLAYGLFKIVGMIVNLYFNCFILLGVLMLYVKLKLTSTVRNEV